MTTIEVKVQHHCETPNMKVGYETTSIPLGPWGIFGVENVVKDVYMQKPCRWSCPECGSKWEWNTIHSLISDHWECVTRTVKWEEVEWNKP